MHDDDRGGRSLCDLCGYRVSDPHRNERLIGISTKHLKPLQVPASSRDVSIHVCLECLAWLKSIKTAVSEPVS